MERKAVGISGRLTRLWAIGWRHFLKVVDRLNYFSSLLTAVATALLAWIALWQFYSLEKTDAALNMAMIASTRAWISPVGAQQLKPFSTGEIAIAVESRNTGRAPSQNTRAKITFILVPVERPGSMSGQRFLAGADDAAIVDASSVCLDQREAISDLPIYGSVFPSESGPNRQSSLSVVPSSAFHLDEAASGKAILVAKGCFFYDTIIKNRRSAFCFFYTPVDAAGEANPRYAVCPGQLIAD